MLRHTNDPGSICQELERYVNRMGDLIMLSEFKAFAMRGNVLDLAVAVVIGGAFGKITTSFVNDIVMPPIGMILGKVDFTNLFINLSSTDYATLAEAKTAGAPTINYGLFITTLLDFVIIAFVVFLAVKTLNRLKRKQEIVKPAPTTRDCPFCATSISLKATRCPNCTSGLTA